MTLRVFTTFSGYDSQCLALDRLGIDYELVGWSEIDRYAIQAHNALYPQWADRNYGDITTIDWAQVPDFDLFTYSSPCQDFSQAGLQRGGEQGSGTRSSLLWECERAIAAKKPKYLLMENVSALVSKKFIKLFNRWQVVLQGYGYKSFPQVLNAKDYGVPQNRERIFLVSILDEEARYEFPKKEKLTRRLKDVLETEVDEKYYLNDEKVQGLLLSTQSEPLHTDKDGNAKTISARYSKESKKKLIENDGEFANTIVAEPIIGAMRGRADGDWYENDHEQRLETRSDGTSNTITGVQKDNLVAEPTVLGWTRDAQSNVIDRHPVEVANCVTAGKRDNTQNYVQEPTKCNVVAMLPDERLHDSARRIYDTDGIAPTQNTQLGGNHETKIIDDTYKGREPREYTENAPAIRSERSGFKVQQSQFRIRKLTPRECFRLMDVSDTDIDKIQAADISDSQQYKLAGNSIVVAVLEKIFYKLFINTEQENEQLKLF